MEIWRHFTVLFFRIWKRYFFSFWWWVSYSPLLLRLMMGDFFREIVLLRILVVFRQALINTLKYIIVKVLIIAPLREIITTIHIIIMFLKEIILHLNLLLKEIILLLGLLRNRIILLAPLLLIGITLQLALMVKTQIGVNRLESHN